MGVKLNPFTGKLDVVDSPSGDFSTVELNRGTEESPSIAFDSDSDTGIYSPGADQVAISTNGQGRLFVGTTGDITVNSSNASASSLTLNSVASNYSELKLQRGGVTYGQLYVGFDDLFLINPRAYNTRFYTNNTERLRITSTGQLSHIGAGSAGSPAVSFNGSAPSNSLVVDSSGRLGVGTGSPLAELHLNDATGLSRMRFTGGAAGADNFEIGQAIVGVSNSGFSIYDIDATATRFVIDSSGNVGIGTTSPGALTHISSSYSAPSTGGIDASTRLIISNNNLASSECNVSILYRSNAKGRLNFGSQLVEDIAYVEGGVNYLAFGTGSGSVAAEERLRITADGNVGIGSQSPADKLSVAGLAPGGEFGALTLRNASSVIGSSAVVTFEVSAGTEGDTAAIASQIKGVRDSGGTSGGLEFWTSNGGTPYQRARIDSSGRLLVGTASNLSASGNRYLQVSNSQPFAILHHNANNPTANTTLAGLEYGGQAGGSYVPGAFIRAQADGNWGTGDAPTRLVFSTNAGSPDTSPTERMRIGSDGNIGFGATGYGLGATETISINPTEGIIGFGNNGREEYITATAGCYIYSGSGASGTTLAGELVLQSRSSVSRPITFVTGSTPTKRMEITGDGYLRLSASSPGIQFGGDTAAANALDDYEEGTFTPTVSGHNTAGTATYTLQAGKYTKIGRLVHVQMYLNWSGGTGAGNLLVSSLPFTVLNTAHSYFPASFGLVDNIALSANHYITGYASLNSTHINVTSSPTGGGAYNNVAYDAAGHLMLSCSYYT